MVKYAIIITISNVNEIFKSLLTFNQLSHHSVKEVLKKKLQNRVSDLFE